MCNFCCLHGFWEKDTWREIPKIVGARQNGRQANGSGWQNTFTALTLRKSSSETQGQIPGMGWKCAHAKSWLAKFTRKGRWKPPWDISLMGQFRNPYNCTFFFGGGGGGEFSSILFVCSINDQYVRHFFCDLSYQVISVGLLVTILNCRTCFTLWTKYSSRKFWAWNLATFTG